MEDINDVKDKILYADHAATTYILPEVMEEMKPYFIEKFGNASSIYTLGIMSKEAIENARKKIACALGALPNEIYYTSGGSESDNLIIRGIAHAHRNKGNHIITTKVEHSAVINTCKDLEKEGYEVTYLDVDNTGKIDLDMLRRSITDKTILVSIMFANNEVGTIQPISEISKITKFKQVIFHTDAVQAVGNIRINVEEMGIDALSLSAHKFYGPKGIGVAYIKEGISFNHEIAGGHQECCKRAGTENTPAIVGMGKALEIAVNNLDRESKRLAQIRDYAINEIYRNVPNAILNGHSSDRLPGNVNFSFKNISGSALCTVLDMNGICASSGSACNSGINKPSHVLQAMNVNPEYIYGSVRLSFGKCNSIEDVDVIVACLKKCINKGEIRLK